MAEKRQRSQSFPTSANANSHIKKRECPPGDKRKTSRIWQRLPSLLTQNNAQRKAQGKAQLDSRKKKTDEGGMGLSFPCSAVGGYLSGSIITFIERSDGGGDGQGDRPLSLMCVGGLNSGRNRFASGEGKRQITGREKNLEGILGRTSCRRFGRVGNQFCCRIRGACKVRSLRHEVLGGSRLPPSSTWLATCWDFKGLCRRRSDIKKRALSLSNISGRGGQTVILGGLRYLSYREKHTFLINGTKPAFAFL